MSEKSQNNKAKAILILSIAFVLIYSSIYIYINSYEIKGQRYFCLFDDAMISMRYAENIANGFGPVWNPNGEPVEGFSNPLWVYIMAIVHLLNIPKPYNSLIIQVLSIVLLIINIFLVKKIAQKLTVNQSIINFSILLTATYLPLLNWSLQGLEVSLIIVLLNLLILDVIDYYQKSKITYATIFIPAILVLTRMDAILFPLILIAIIFIKLKQKSYIYISKIILSIAIALIILFIWRKYYYGEILPNTYYLKMTGYPIMSRIGKGLYAFLKFAIYLTPFFLLLPFWNFYKNKDYIFALLLAPLTISIIYSIYIGGDSWEWWLPANRFIAITIPLFIIAVLLSLEKYLNKYFLIFALIFLLSLNFNNWEYLKGELLIEKTFTEKDNRHHTNLALEAHNIIKPNATVAVTIAGTLPYFLERNCIDILGKNDKAIARMKVLYPIPFTKYNPGHIKWNYSYSIGILKPDAVLQLWEKPNTAIPFLSEDYETYNLAGSNVFFLKNSKNINWDYLYSNY